MQAFSAYYFVMNFLNLTDTSVPLDTVKNAMARYCATPWDQVGTFVLHTQRHMHARALDEAGQLKQQNSKKRFTGRKKIASTPKT